MFATDNKLKKAVRIILDIINVLVGIAVVVLAVLTFMNTAKNIHINTWINFLKFDNQFLYFISF